MTQEIKLTETSVASEEGRTESQVQVVPEYDIDGFLTKRAEFIEKVNRIMIEGKDYHVIQGKKSMAKGGAEKIGSIFNWQAAFKKDTESLDMFGDAVKGTVAFICTLTKDQSFIGEGRGASMLSKNGGDPNKTIKMAQKSAFIDAVLRASGLSDFFTQDLEDMNIQPQQQDRPAYNQQRRPNYQQPRTIDAKDVILNLLTQLGYDRSMFSNRQSVETVILNELGISLTGTPANLKEIVEGLQVLVKQPRNQAIESPQTETPPQNDEWIDQAVKTTAEAIVSPQNGDYERISQPQLNLLTSLIEQKLKTPKNDRQRQLEDLKFFYSPKFSWLNDVDSLENLSADDGRTLNNFLVHEQTIQ